MPAGPNTWTPADILPEMVQKGLPNPQGPSPPSSWRQTTPALLPQALIRSHQGSLKTQKPGLLTDPDLGFSNHKPLRCTNIMIFAKCYSVSTTSMSLQRLTGHHWELSPRLSCLNPCQVSYNKNPLPVSQQWTDTSSWATCKREMQGNKYMEPIKLLTKKYQSRLQKHMKAVF